MQRSVFCMLIIWGLILFFSATIVDSVAAATTIVNCRATPTTNIITGIDLVEFSVTIPQDQVAQVYATGVVSIRVLDTIVDMCTCTLDQAANCACTSTVVTPLAGTSVVSVAAYYPGDGVYVAASSIPIILSLIDSTVSATITPSATESTVPDPTLLTTPAGEHNIN